MQSGLFSGHALSHILARQVTASQPPGAPLLAAATQATHSMGNHSNLGFYFPAPMNAQAQRPAFPAQPLTGPPPPAAPPTCGWPATESTAPPTCGWPATESAQSLQERAAIAIRQQLGAMPLGNFFPGAPALGQPSGGNLLVGGSLGRGATPKWWVPPTPTPEFDPLWQSLGRHAVGTAFSGLPPVGDPLVTATGCPDVHEVWDPEDMDADDQKAMAAAFAEPLPQWARIKVENAAKAEKVAEAQKKASARSRTSVSSARAPRATSNGVAKPTPPVEPTGGRKRAPPRRLSQSPVRKRGGRANRSPAPSAKRARREPAGRRSLEEGGHLHCCACLSFVVLCLSVTAVEMGHASMFLEYQACCGVGVVPW
jgi:hypothetical protein